MMTARPMRGPVVVAVALVCVAGVSCRPVDTSWHDEGGVRWRALDVARRGRPGFERLASTRSGITHANVVDDAHALANRNLLIGSGVAVGDIDGDGLPDLFFGSLEQPSALYRNLGDARFANETVERGLRTEGLAVTGAAFADLDGDGDLDLVAGTLGGPMRLWQNDGRGRFADATAGAGLDSGFAATTLTLADVDGDGDLDLYVATYKYRNALDALTPQERAFEQVVRKVGNRYEVRPELAKEYRVEDRPDLGGVLRTQRAERDLFYLNDGKGRFTAQRILGPRFRDEAGRPLTVESDFFSLAARFYDFTGDGFPDLYVCNDFEDPDEIWVNDGAGNFRQLAALAIRETSNTCMSVEFADIDRDGHVDIFTADMMSPTLAQRHRQIPTHTPLPKRIGLTPDRNQWMQNMLQRARGDGTFAQIADFAGVAATDWTWGSAFLDVDLDGFEDLLVVNGHRWDVRDADTFERIRNSYPRVPWNREQGEFPELKARNFAFRNRGDLTFEDASARWGFSVDSTISHAIALGDLDGDGDLDLVETRLNEPAVVYRNTTGAPRLAIRLNGGAGNSGGIGARVTVRARGLPAQSREMTSGGLYLAGSEQVLTFATGGDAAPSVEVRWPDGSVDTLTARANALYEITKGARPGSAMPAAKPTPLFADATALLGGHAHVETPFDDYSRQPLLPMRFSQLGPAVAWADVDADGRDDLVVGAGRGGRMAALLNGAAGFREATAMPPAPWDVTGVVPIPSPGGGFVFAAGQSNYEASSPGEAAAAPGVVEVRAAGGRLQPGGVIAGGDTASVGPLALGDLNGDGLLDLFIGARVAPSQWPVSKPSRILLRTADGGWRADTDNTAVLRGLGLVSAAIWSDLNGDGASDLVVTSEWGPVRLLENRSGRLVDVTEQRGLGERFSRWNGLTVGDFNGDGRLDLVATSWGRNAPWGASVERPHVLHVGSFGGTGVGLLFARRQLATGPEMPLESFARLGVAIPLVRERIASFAEYAAMSVEALMRATGTQGVRLGATTYDHTVFMNRGTRFEAVSLPSLVQLAPAFGVAVADFDGDGNEDLVLGQNFSATEISSPRLASGGGAILLGDGAGGFRPLEVSESGLSVLGDARGVAIADYDGDGRPDVAIAQNGARTTLWRNATGKPGLRVRVDIGPNNPTGVGAMIRRVHAGGRGPTREIHAGSGYWSVDAATTVLGGMAAGDSVWVRWPGGQEQVVAAPAAGPLTLRAARPTVGSAPTASRSR